MSYKLAIAAWLAIQFIVVNNSRYTESIGRQMQFDLCYDVSFVTAVMLRDSSST